MLNEDEFDIMMKVATTRKKVTIKKIMKNIEQKDPCIL